MGATSSSSSVGRGQFAAKRLPVPRPARRSSWADRHLSSARCDGIVRSRIPRPMLSRALFSLRDHQNGAVISFEQDENTVRKDFTPTDAVAIGRLVEDQHRATLQGGAHPTSANDRRRLVRPRQIARERRAGPDVMKVEALERGAARLGLIGPGLWNSGIAPRALSPADDRLSSGVVILSAVRRATALAGVVAPRESESTTPAAGVIHSARGGSRNGFTSASAAGSRGIVTVAKLSQSPKVSRSAGVPCRGERYSHATSSRQVDPAARRDVAGTSSV
jgi:hypothetical protein